MTLPSLNPLSVPTLPETVPILAPPLTAPWLLGYIIPIKKRNVLARLPESEKANVGLPILRAYKEFDYSKVKAELGKLADNLDYCYPKAAASQGVGRTAYRPQSGDSGTVPADLIEHKPDRIGNLYLRRRVQACQPLQRR